MSFGGLILTNQGRNKIAAAISNEKALDFTHVQLGDGTYNDSYPSKKELTNMVMEIPVTRVSRRDNEVTIDCDWNSSQAPRGFFFREIGIIGNGALCYYDNAGAGEAEYIDPKSEMVSKEKRIRLTVVVDDNVNVTVHTASSLYALATELDKAVDELVKKLNTAVNTLNSVIGQKANQTDLNTHVNNSAIHFTETERDKLSGIAAEANKYTHPASAAGAKTSGLYKITTDANGHVIGVTAVKKEDITALGIPGQDTNTTYGQATYSKLGLTKLYSSSGDNEDGTITQDGITDLLDNKITKPAVLEVKPTSYNDYAVPLYYMGNATFAILIITCGAQCCVALIRRDESLYYRYKIISSGGYISVSDSEWSSNSSAFFFKPYPGVTYKITIFAIA